MEEMEKERGQVSPGAVWIGAWRHGRTWHGMFGGKTKVQNGEKGA